MAGHRLRTCGRVLFQSRDPVHALDARSRYGYDCVLACVVWVHVSHVIDHAGTRTAPLSPVPPFDATLDLVGRVGQPDGDFLYLRSTTHNGGHLRAVGELRANLCGGAIALAAQRSAFALYLDQPGYGAGRYGDARRS